MQKIRSERCTYVFGKENLGFLIDVRKVHVHEYAVYD
jgi:hypothetical protein